MKLGIKLIIGLFCLLLISRIVILIRPEFISFFYDKEINTILVRIGAIISIVVICSIIYGFLNLKRWAFILFFIDFIIGLASHIYSIFIGELFSRFTIFMILYTLLWIIAASYIFKVRKLFLKPL